MKTNFKPVALITPFLMLGAMPSCETAHDSAEVQNEARNEAAVRAILAAMDSGNYSVFDQYVAPDFQISNPFLPQPGNLDVFKRLMQGQKAGFPDLHHDIILLVAKGNTVWGRGVFKGTNTGSMMGHPPTGNKVELPFIFLDEFNNEGKLKNRYVQFDTGTFNAQLMTGKTTG